MSDELDPRLLQVLVCPTCKGELVARAKGLVCAPCKRLFPVVDGVPRMAPEESLRSDAAGS